MTAGGVCVDDPPPGEPHGWCTAVEVCPIGVCNRASTLARMTEEKQPTLTPELHNFRLYRSGWSGKEAPWDDNQLWAKMTTPLMLGTENAVIMEPWYGSAASLYRLDLIPLESPETGWVTWRARLSVNAESMGDWVPLSWYVGAPADWPSGLARFPEVHGPQLPGRRYDENGPRGVWSLAARRAQ